MKTQDVVAGAEYAFRAQGWRAPQRVVAIGPSGVKGRPIRVRLSEPCFTTAGGEFSPSKQPAGAEVAVTGRQLGPTWAEHLAAVAEQRAHAQWRRELEARTRALSERLFVVLALEGRKGHGDVTFDVYPDDTPSIEILGEEGVNAIDELLTRLEGLDK